YYLLSKLKNQGLDTSKGDVPWFKTLPQKSVLLFATTVGMLGIGLNMSLSNSTEFQTAHINTAAQVALLERDLQSNLVPRKSLPVHLTGKVFVNAGSGTTPSKVLYVVANGDGTFNANVVTLDIHGVLSPLPPNANNVPFFIAQTDGSIAPNPAAGTPMASQAALLAVANAS